MFCLLLFLPLMPMVLTRSAELTRFRKSLAHAELYLTLATVFRRYGEAMMLWETVRKDIEPARDFFVPAPEPGGNGLRVTVS